MTGLMWLAIIFISLWVLSLIVNGVKNDRTAALRIQYLLDRAEARQRDREPDD